MNIFNKFCFCVNLRKGCLVYGWVQMILVAIAIGKLSFLSNLIKEEFHELTETLTSGHIDILVGIQLIKILSSLALIWGIIKTQHMYYEPWLFINGLENSLLIIQLIFFFILGCLYDADIITKLCVPSAILAVYGWYMWSLVYTVYKLDIKPSSIKFEENHDDEDDTICTA